MDIGIDKTLKSMRSATENAEAQRNGALMIKEFLSSDREQAAETLLACNGLHTITAGMFANRNSAQVQRWGAAAISSLVEHGGVAAAVVVLEQEGLDAVLLGMRSHRSSAEVQSWGASALCNIAGVGSEQAVAALVVTSSIELLVDGMRLHPDIAMVQECGMRALGYVALDEADVVLQQGGIQAILEGLRNFPYDAKVQCGGLVALWSILEHAGESEVSAVVDNGGIELTFAALRQLPDHLDVQCWSLAVLRYVPMHCNQVAVMIMIDDLPEIVSAMERGIKNTEVQEKALGALRALTGWSALATEAVINHALGAVIAAMRAHEGSYEVQVWALGLLSKVAEEVYGAAAVLDAGAAAACVAAMRTNLQVLNLQSQGQALLWALTGSCGEPAMLAIVEEGGIEALTNAVEAHPTCTELQDKLDSWRRLLTESSFVRAAHSSNLEVDSNPLESSFQGRSDEDQDTTTATDSGDASVQESEDFDEVLL